MSMDERECPGCGLRMPYDRTATYDGYFYTSPECWKVFTEVLATEYGNAVVFGRVHQLTVDSYAVQHAGGMHPDKSVAVHLSGLHLAMARGIPPMKIPPLLQQLVSKVRAWPHFAKPTEYVKLTAFDVAMADSLEEHIQVVQDWASAVWTAWSPCHEEVAAFVAQHIDPNT